MKQLLPRIPKYGHFWPSCRQNWNKNSVGNRFLIFSFFLSFWGFLGSKSRKFEKFAQKPAKNLKKVKISKICFLQNFCIIFVCNLAKNGHIWVFWAKVVSFFLGWKISFFFGVFLYKPWKPRLGPNFVTSYLGNAKSFFNSVKSSWKHVFQSFRTNQMKAKQNFEPRPPLPP